MIEPNLAPNDCVGDIEGVQSSSPVQGVGAHLRTLDPGNGSILRGRVDDIYMNKNCAVVAVYGYRMVPCWWASDSLNQLTGAKTVAPPSIGTEVGIILSMDQKYGYIVAVFPSASNTMPTPTIFATSVSQGSDKEVHIAKNFGFDSFCMAARGGIPVDVLPGDHVIVNGQGALLAVLELMSSVAAGGSSSFESFVLDQLTRDTGWNQQVRNSLLERNTMEDWGRITEEESGTHLIAETMGNDPDGAVPGNQMGAARRFQNLRGFLGGLIQQWIMRPNSKPADMTKAQDQPDMGLLQKVEMLSGLFATRSVVGGGLLKMPAIAVPKRKKFIDDPTGNVKAPEDTPTPPFKFDNVPETPVSQSCQTRDFLAYIFNRQLTRRLQEQDLDWDVPDEATCAALAEGLKAPGLGRFFRDFPPEVDAMSDSTQDGITKDPSEVMKTRSGTSWVLQLPNGGISIRDIWGSQIEMSGGHIDITASKDIRLSAGRSLVLLGGDDLVIKGRNSVDISSTLNQVRIKAQKELFIHAEQGGMLISLGSLGNNFRDGAGEDQHLPGICIKTPGGFIIDANQLTANLSGNFYVGPGTDGIYPDFSVQANSVNWDVKKGVMAMRFASGAAEINGSLFLSGGAIIEGGCYVKGSGVFGSQPTFPGDWSKSTPVSQIVATAMSNIDKLQYPYSLEELKAVQFKFRTDAQYGTTEGRWFESFWQREVDETDAWIEAPAGDGSYPYPGKDNYTENKNWWTYAEQNVEPIGRSKARDSLSNEPSGFTPDTWNKFKVHPIKV